MVGVLLAVMVVAAVVGVGFSVGVACAVEMPQTLNAAARVIAPRCVECGRARDEAVIDRLGMGGSCLQCILLSTVSAERSV